MWSYVVVFSTGGVHMCACRSVGLVACLQYGVGV